LVAPIGAVMICGVPVAAIAEPHSVSWPGVGLPELLLEPVALPPAGFGLVGPVELLADPADWFPNTEFGFVGELGLEEPLGVPAEPADCVALEFDVPNTVLGFAGELGLGGTAGLSPGPTVWLIPVFEVPITELGFAGEFGFVGTEGVPAEPPDWMVPVFDVPITELGFAGEFGFVGTEGVPAAPPA
jgi:hypothetical protein